MEVIRRVGLSFLWNLFGFCLGFWVDVIFFYELEGKFESMCFFIVFDFKLFILIVFKYWDESI